jgi:hypothetical protein
LFKIIVREKRDSSVEVVALENWHNILNGQRSQAIQFVIMHHGNVAIIAVDRYSLTTAPRKEHYQIRIGRGSYRYGEIGP